LRRNALGATKRRGSQSLSTMAMEVRQEMRQQEKKENNDQDKGESKRRNKSPN
jgi:hypothetical protein